MKYFRNSKNEYTSVYINMQLFTSRIMGGGGGLLLIDILPLDDTY